MKNGKKLMIIILNNYYFKKINFVKLKRFNLFIKEDIFKLDKLNFHFNDIIKKYEFLFLYKQSLMNIIHFMNHYEIIFIIFGKKEII